MAENLTELEQMVAEEEIEPTPDNSALSYSKYAYNIAVVLLDLVTGWTIYQLTFWYYGVMWFLAGAVVFYLHQKNWERDGNNEKQVNISQVGMVLSVGSMLLMALITGGLWIAKANGAAVNLMWSEIGIVSFAIGLYAYHAVQLARYYFLDDEFVIKRTVARAKAQANKKIQIIKAGGEVVKANREALQEKNAQYKKHGSREAVDMAINRIEGKKQQPQPVYATDTGKPELKEPENPTNPHRQNGK